MGCFGHCIRVGHIALWDMFMIPLLSIPKMNIEQMLGTGGCLWLLWHDSKSHYNLGAMSEVFYCQYCANLSLLI